jgi:hypothetical protein
VTSPASPARIPAAFWRIQAACDTLTAPLDALLAEFAALAVDTAPPTNTSMLAEFAALAVGTASPTTPSPVPTAMLTPSPRPRSYLDTVVGPNGRGYTSSAPPSPSVTPSHPSAAAPTPPTVGKSRRATPRRRTGRRNGPRAPSPPDEASPAPPDLVLAAVASHPQPTMGGTSTLTPTLTSARANDRAPRLHQPSLHVLQATTAHESAAVTLHRTACRHKRPRRRPGRRNVPRAPNPPDEAIPSHPLPMTGGTSMPTTTHHTSARANDRDHRSNMSSPSLLPMTLPSPSHQPFTIEGGNSTSSGGGFNDSFRDNSVILPPRECPRRKYCPRRVGRRHGPRAPNPLDHLACGGRHRPRASNQSTGWALA